MSIAQDFRFKKKCECQNELENEISHYQQMNKKYKKVKSITSKIATSTVILTTVFTSSGLVVFLNGIGFAISWPLVGLAGVMSLLSTTFSIGSGRLRRKISKHEKTVSLAESKHL